MNDLAIVGAGLAGLSCARSLQDGGRSVVVIDKGRGPGGRCSTRRAGDFAFDHGAQYFTALDEDFCNQVAELREAGRVDLWEGRIRRRDDGRIRPLEGSTERLVGCPGMNELPKALAESLEVDCSRRITALERIGSGWQLGDEAGETIGPFAGLVLNMPPEQALALLPADFEHRDVLEKVKMAPSLALMIRLEDEIDAGFDGLFVNDDEVLGWVARDGSKPGRSCPRSWVLHARADYSEMNFRADEEGITEAMLASFASILGERPAQDHAALMRWRYALPLDEDAEHLLLDEKLGIGVCGDWCAGGRVEGAWLSGRALAAAILES